MNKYQFEIEVAQGQYKSATVNALDIGQAKRRAEILSGGRPIRN